VSQGSLYQRLLGTRYAELPAAVQRFHRLSGHHHLAGEVEIDAPAGWAARLLARCLGAPRTAQRGALRFELHAGAREERWVLHFQARTMRSRLSLHRGRLVERLGAARLTFALEASGHALHMHLERLEFLGIPCPRSCMPRVLARETGEHDLHFHVEARVPLLGTVAAYRGRVVLPQGEGA
jgi:hypothetical protein